MRAHDARAHEHAAMTGDDVDVHVRARQQSRHAFDQGAVRRDVHDRQLSPRAQPDAAQRLVWLRDAPNDAPPFDGQEAFTHSLVVRHVAEHATSRRDAENTNDPLSAVTAAHVDRA